LNILSTLMEYAIIDYLDLIERGVRKLISDYLTNELKSTGKVTMTTEYAWKCTDVLEVIKFLSDNTYAILGCDVLNDNLSYTYDNWSYTYDKSLTLEKNIEESVLKIIEYIDWYSTNFGDNYYYIIVAEKKADYLLMQENA